MIDPKIVQEELEEEEGVKYYAYLDTVKILTVGIGHNLIANPSKPIIGRAITVVGQKVTEKEVEQLFNYDLQNVMKDLDKHLVWWRELDDVRQYVLISLCFNLGIHGLLKFKNTLHFYKLGMYSQAADNLKQSKWYKQVKTRGVKLIRLLKTGSF